MKIYCPKCHTCYSIETGLIPPDGKSLRCSRCGEVWTCYHSDMEADPSDDEENVPQNVIANDEDAIITTPNSEEEGKEGEENAEEGKAVLSEDEMTLIFSRLKDENTKLDTEIENLSPAKKIWPKIKKLLGWNRYSTVLIEISIILLMIALAIFGYRYDLVRKFPQTEILFSQLNVPSRVIGEGLEFQNVVRSYDSQEQPRLLTIKGYIYNTTNNTLSIPVILINIMDKDGEMMAQDSQKIEATTIEAQNRVAFSLQTEVPQKAKYIELTFTE